MQTIKATVKNPWSDSLSLIHMRVRVVTQEGDEVVDGLVALHDL